MKKRILCISAISIVVAVVLGIAIFFATHVSIRGTYFPRNAPVYDLTGFDLSVEEYTDLRSRFPDSQILWNVPFQGSRYPTTTEKLTLTALTEEDVLLLDHFPQLKQVDGSQCPDLDNLLLLQARRPSCQVLYQVPLGSENCSCLSTAFTAADATAEQLDAALPLLPRLRQLTLEGELPAPEVLLRLREAFPDVTMTFSMDICGQTCPSAAQTMDFTGLPVTFQELSRLLPLFPALTEVNLTDTPLSDSELKALATQLPDIFFLCTMDFVGIPLSTDTTEIDISRRKDVTVEEIEALLPFFPHLKKLNMSRCGIDDETMDALNRRHPDTSIVWTLQIGLVTLRTDATVFFPASINELSLPSEEQLKKLRYCTEMVAVDVGHCHTSNCDWAQYMPHLKYLIIADTSISDLTPLSGLKELVYLEVFSTDVVDYSPLLGCTALQDLNVGNTFGDPEPLSRMTWLHNLYWFGTKRDPALYEKTRLLPEQLPDTNVVLTGGRNIDAGWRYLPNYYLFRDYIGGSFFNQEGIQSRWGFTDGERIMACDKSIHSPPVHQVLAEIIRYRIDNGLPIPGVKNVGSEKAEILYQTVCASGK